MNRVRQVFGLPLVVLLLLLFVSGCFGSKTREKESWASEAAELADSGAGLSSGTNLRGTPEEIATTYPRPKECERVARMEVKRNSDRGWAILRACVARGKFTLLSKLLEEDWVEEFRNRKDAAEVLAAVVAERGGDVGTDMKTIHPLGIKLYDVQTAIKGYSRLAGGLVLFRGTINDNRPAAKGYEMEVAEMAVGSKDGGKRTESETVWNRSGGGGGGSTTWTYTRSKDTYADTVVETGTLIWATGGNKDSYLISGQDLVLLGKIQGVSKNPNLDAEAMETEDKVLLVKILRHWPVKTNVMLTD